MAPAHYLKMAQLSSIRCACPKTTPQFLLSARRRLRSTIITLATICLTTQAALGDDGSTTRSATQPDVGPTLEKKVFGKGDTLTSILKESRVADEDIQDATHLLGREVKLNQIPVGQTLDLYLDESVNNNGHKAKMLGLILHRTGERHWAIVRSLTQKLVLQKLSQPQATTAIHSSLDLTRSTESNGSFTHTITLRQGQTLISLLRSSGLSERDVGEAIKTLAPQLDLRSLPVNQRFTLKIQSLNGDIRLVSLTAIDTPAGHVTITLPLEEATASPAKPTNPIPEKKTSSQTTNSVPDKNEISKLPVEPQHKTSSPGIPAELYREELISIKKGDSFAKRLLGSGAAAQDVYNAAQTLSQNIDFAQLPVGQKIQLLFAQITKEHSFLLSVIVSPGSANALRVNRKKDGTYSYEPLSNDALSTISHEENTDTPLQPASPIVKTPYPNDLSIEIIKIEPGDTLENILRRQRVSPKEVRLALRSLDGVYNIDNIRAGKKIALQFNLSGGGYQLQKLILGAPSNKTVVIEYVEGRYTAYRASDSLMKKAVQISQHLYSLQADLKAGKLSQTAIENYGFNTPDNALVRTNLRQPTTILIQEGDTLFDALVNSNVRPLEAERAISAARKLTNPRKLKPGQMLHLLFGKATTAIPSETGTILAELSIDLNVKQRLRVARLLDGTFVAGFVARSLKTKKRKARGIINSNLYEAASGKNVPAKTLAKLIRIFSYDVDFQRDIREGDKFEILYEVLVDDGGRNVDVGAILYSSLNLSGTSLNVYKFTLKDQGIDDYFDDQGQSVRKALMRTPIDGARLTSTYGNRKHPTLGYTQMHRGVDFGAPRGTPIFAAGDGVVDKLGSHGAYGNYLRLRHGPVYQTAYAHLHKFAPGLHTGQRVKQGETIGFVGSTGRSTGPHLHYEVLKHGKQVNPLGVKLPSGLLLQGGQLTKFKEEREQLLKQFASETAETP